MRKAFDSILFLKILKIFKKELIGYIGINQYNKYVVE